MLKIVKYKSCQIHYVNALYKYDIYDNEGRWITSKNRLADCKKYITNLLWARNNVPY